MNQLGNNLMLGGDSAQFMSNFGGSVDSNNLHRSIDSGVLQSNGAGAAGHRSRGALTRVRSFVFRQFSELRERYLAQLIGKIMCELSVIIFMVVLNVTLRSIEVKTEYSKNERDWVCETITELTLVILGFTLFRAFTIDLSSAENEFVAKSIGLIFF